MDYSSCCHKVQVFSLLQLVIKVMFYGMPSVPFHCCKPYCMVHRIPPCFRFEV
ncbi:hypothetical protein L208DRAFT_352835 [Tricholoma matsutake]|nr:hypothetical protein L208DRAFT_352835 [Tricholoma matsutake 945]